MPTPEEDLDPKVVYLDETLFYEVFPQFSGVVTASQLQFYWETVKTFVDNTPASVIPYDTEKSIYIRRTVMYFVLCHLLTINKMIDAGQNEPLTSASTGSVSTSFGSSSGMDSGDKAAWFKQTQCGKTAWSMMSRYMLGGLYFSKHNYHPWG